MGLCAVLVVIEAIATVVTTDRAALSATARPDAPTAPADRAATDRATEIDRLRRSLDAVEEQLEALQRYHRERVEPVARHLEARRWARPAPRTRASPSDSPSSRTNATGDDPASGRLRLHADSVAGSSGARIGASPTGSVPVQRIALALVREGERVGIDPRLLAAVLLVENPWLDPAAVSPVGAVGLMQVMPFHAGAWGCARTDLTDVEGNVCHATEILAHYLRTTRGDLSAALLRYNGCRYGTNTPDCHEYPDRVYRSAGPEWMAEIAASAPRRHADDPGREGVEDVDRLPLGP